jgi:hypothetical protein
MMIDRLCPVVGHETVMPVLSPQVRYEEGTDVI